MFDVGWSELVVIAVVALVVIGPKELPGVLRSIGFWMGKVRRMASEFQGQFQEAMREAEMSDLKKDVDDLNSAASGLTDFNPLSDAQKAIDSAFDPDKFDADKSAPDKSDADKALAPPASDAAADTTPSSTTTSADSPPADDASGSPDDAAPRKQAGA
jgi:sec-independent protein translocase protein TatB